MSFIAKDVICSISICCHYLLKNALSTVLSSHASAILSLSILMLIIAGKNINAVSGSNTSPYDLPLINLDKLKFSSSSSSSTTTMSASCSSEFAKNLIVSISSRGDPMPANINDILSLMSGGGSGSDWSIKTCDILCQVLTEFAIGVVAV